MRDCDTKCETNAFLAVIKWVGIIAILATLAWALVDSANAQSSTFDTKTKKYGFFVNHTDDFLEVSIAGRLKIVKPYWAARNSATEMNAFKLWLTPEKEYTLKVRLVILAEKGKPVIQLGEWKIYKVKLANNADTPFTLEYGLPD